MIPAKQYLGIELRNARSALRDCLRFQYGGERRAEFYSEFLDRIQSLEIDLDQSADEDSETLTSLLSQFSALSRLIARLERSHIGEFAWPFANELGRLASDITPTADGKEPPLYFFSAEGGDSAYKQYAGQMDGERRGREVHHIAFPRTLKHHVLLHAVLGHEIGHAIFLDEQVRPIANRAYLTLIADSPLEDKQSFSEYYSKYIAKDPKALSDKAFRSLATSWAVEVCCDLFGLLCLGPAYVPAYLTILRPQLHGRVSLSMYHPQVHTRDQALWTLAENLNWPSNEREVLNGLGLPNGGSIFSGLKERSENGDGYEPNQFFKEAAVLDAANLIENEVLSQSGRGAFRHQSSDYTEGLVEQLGRSIPPIMNTSTGPKHVDFREILYAGWLAWTVFSVRQQNKSDDTFEHLNRLCSHSILQQQGVRIIEGDDE